MRKTILIVVSLAICTPALGQTNLLVNPNFSLPAGTPCGPGTGYRDFTFPTGWTYVPMPVPPVWNYPNTRYVGKNEENETELINLCPGGPNADGYYCALVTAGGLTSATYVYQTVSTGITPGTPYKLSGVWAGASRIHPDGRRNRMRIRVQLLDGDQNGPILKERTVLVGDRWSFQLFTWDNITPLIVTPTGSQLTVKFYGERVDASYSNLQAVAVDDLVLAAETGCTLQPEITEPGGILDSVTNDRTVPRGSTRTLTINGANFTPGSMSVKLKKEYSPDVPGTVLSSTATSITANFALPADMTLGPWDVVVTGPGCDPAIANGVLEVHLPAFTNGGFESPAAAAACDPTRTAAFPADWLAEDCGHWRHDTVWGDLYPAVPPGDAKQNFLNLNGYVIGGLLGWKPTCPTDGNNYGTMARINPGINTSRSARAFETFTANPGSTYTLSGLFAWKGNSRVRIGLLDGDSGVLMSNAVANPPPTNNKVLADGNATANWRFGYYSAVAGTPRMTAFFQSQQLDTTSTEVSLHADALSVKPCLSVFTLGSITPTKGEAGKIVQISSISGTGFLTAPELPAVIFVGPSVLFGTNVQVSGGSSLSCRLDLTNAAVGTYNVIVMQQGCVNDTSLAGAFQVIAPVQVGLESISPVNGTNDGPIAVTLAGTNLEGLTTVKLVRDVGLAEIVGSLAPPAGPGQTTRQATFNLTGAEMGRYHVVPTAVGGALPLDRAFLVVLTAPSNLSFETGTSAADPAGGPCVNGTWDRSRARDWDTVPDETSWRRDARFYFTAPCPQDGDHFASFSAWEAATLRAFQTIKVTTGQQVDVSAYLHARTADSSMPHQTRLILLDGDENGTEVTSVEVSSPVTWEQMQITGAVFSRLATVVIEMTGNSGRASSNIDNMSIVLSGGCSRIEVDADNDGDVDQADFAAFQACFSGDGVSPPTDQAYYCRCFDRERDTDVDTTDYNAFENCATGPGIPLDADNPPAGCVP